MADSSETKIVKRSQGVLHSCLSFCFHLFDPLFPKEPTLVKTKSRGVTYFLWLNEFTGQRLYVTRRYEQKDRTRLKRLIKPGDVCLDVGANSGIYTLFMASLVGAAGHVHAFEPLYENAKVINEAAEYNGFQNVTVSKSVVSSEKGLGFDSTKVPLGDSGLAYFSEAGNAQDAEFSTVSIDSYLEDSEIPQVDVIKIDVEGAELSVLHGASKLLSSNNAPRVLLIEVVDEYLERFGHRQAELFDLMGSYGYVPYTATRLGGFNKLEEPADKKLSNVFFLKG